MDFIAAHHRQVHANQFDFVGLADAQRLGKRVGEIREFGVFDKLRRFRIELLPDFVKHLEVVLAQWLGALLGGHAEVLQYNRDVHVDHDEKRNNNVGYEERDAHRRIPAVSANVGSGVRNIRVALLRRVV